MRILFIGQAPFGAESLEYLIKQGENIVGVITVPDVVNQRHPNPVKQCAEKHEIPLFQSKFLKNDDAISWVTQCKPDLLVLAFVTAFVPQKMIDIARLGGINYHPSLLPKYRGGSAINWAVINGEKETGVTIHAIDEGVDTGPILLQEKIAIDPDDTVKSIYFGHLYPMGIRMIGEAVRLIGEGKNVAATQDETKASFQPVITTKDTIIDWNQPTEKVYNLIRGANPAPGASTKINDITCKIFDARIGKGSGVPGEVTHIDVNSIGIATADGVIEIQVLQPSGEKKISAADFAVTNQIQCGNVI